MLYVRFSEEPIDHTVQVDDLRVIDYSVDNAVVGLEFVDASGGVDLRDMPFRARTEALLGDSCSNSRCWFSPCATPSLSKSRGQILGLCPRPSRLYRRRRHRGRDRARDP